MKRLLAVLAGLLLIPAASAHAAFEHYSPPDPQKVDFVVNCFKSTTGNFDPIVMPGMSMAHLHQFAGNLSVNPNSNEFTLGAATTNCTMSRNRTSYWTPVLSANGTPVYPGLDLGGGKQHQFRAYYRANSSTDELLQKVQPIPFGLRIIAGNAGATAPQSGSIARFQCRNLATGNTVPTVAYPIPNCASGDFLEPSIVFPNCWDGVHLDSADHKSHMSYSKSNAMCDTAHPVRLPQLTLALRYPVNAFLNKTVSIATLGPSASNQYTLHADAFFAWDPATMNAFVQNCIHASIGCEDVSDGRLPPAMNGKLPTDTTPKAPAVVDTDKDGVPDSSDACPSQAGTQSNGCPPPPPPDGDNDGVPDTDDNCPMAAGPTSNGGCPLPVDTDGDGVIDTDDNCPTTVGSSTNDGCPLPAPDQDADGVADQSDDCPADAGPASNGGCPVPPPDGDGDGVPDSTDGCPTTSGPSSNNGCPLPATPVVVDAENGFTLDPTTAGQVQNDTTATGGKALRMWSNSTASKLITVPVSSSVGVKVKAINCSGGPAFDVLMDGAVIGSSTVTATNYITFTVTKAIPAGAHTFAVRYTNDVSTCSSRDLWFDKITVTP